MKPCEVCSRPTENQLCEDCKRQETFNEINLRDRFAMAALTGMVSNSTLDGHTNEFAKWAYEYADEMMKARE